MTECGCSEICRLDGWADQFQPATRELMVFTKNPKRYFDVDAVRQPLADSPGNRYTRRSSNWERGTGQGGRGDKPIPPNQYSAGAPPLDWWRIDPDQPPAIPERKGDPMTATFYVGDAIETMNKLPEKSVDLILTSPPFLALRSYLPADHPDKALEGGSQATPGAFIDWLIDVVEACDRVLAPHGSMCIELGDTYAGSGGAGGAGGDYDPGGWREGQEAFEGSGKRYIDSKYERIQYGDKGPPIANLHGKKQGGGTGWPLPKSLSLIPELFRLTLVYGTNPLTGRTTDRWRLRNVVRWVRPNPPVGALGDKFRPATSELMVFCKSAKRYFDLGAVRETPKEHSTKYDGGTHKALRHSLTKGNSWGDGEAKQMFDNPAGAPPLDWWEVSEHGFVGPGTSQRDGAQLKTPAGLSGEVTQEPQQPSRWLPGMSGAPPLDWWNIPPGGYEGAHYAVFPPELCIKPIKAMCPEKVCRQCGEPSRRIVEKTEEYAAFRAARTFKDVMPGATARQLASAEPHGVTTSIDHHKDGGARGQLYETQGFSDCGHDNWRPGLVLDPFGGSGTTALVATGHGRDCILIDLDERNYDLALERVGPFILERAG